MNNKVKVMVLVGIFSMLLFGSRIMSQSHHQEVSHKYYTSLRIEHGDTLWEIAQTHMGSEYDKAQDYINEVKQINRLAGDKIHAGMYLIIPYCK